MKKLIYLLALLALFVPHAILRADAIDDLRKRIREREAEIKALEAEIAKYQEDLIHQANVSQTLKNETLRLEAQIKKLTADIQLTNSKIQKAQLTISAFSFEIGEAEKQIENDHASLGELLRSLEENGDQSLMEIFLAGESMADFFGEASALETVTKELGEKLDDIRAEKAVLEDERTKKQKEEQTLTLLHKDLSGQKTAQISVETTKKQLLKESKNQETRYQKTLKEREERRALIQKELKTIEDQLRTLIDPRSLPGKAPGVLGWPVADPYVTQGFGFTDFATTYGSDVYKGSGHNGIDFRASIGTPILASDNGIVKDTGDTDTLCPGGSYGKWVIIDHGNNLSTLYGHLSVISAAKGQKVTRGERIGYSGNTGYATGPHLHFTVYAANTYRLHKSTHCGLIPAGGYLNPTDYL
ncbi:MAG: peptidoglycan DD-metalloendopeptidase family protein [Candidatus Ryanbacteria bacterium]|nr:peptidoglycan DD-metalloendopeptidase family protein [Candidatus Ryanbacteria bacterium]